MNTFFHKVNGLYLSRVERFQTNTGPNSNLTTFFRGYYESVWINDSINAEITKSFNVFLFNLKYQTKIFSKQLFLFYLGEFHSVQGFLRPVPVFSNKALLRNHFHELDAYLQLSKKMALVGYHGREFIYGNRDAGIGDVLNQENRYSPKRGVGIVYGLGLDYNISKLPEGDLGVRNLLLQVPVTLIILIRFNKVCISTMNTGNIRIGQALGLIYRYEHT